jgi:hypothetical protein
MTSLRLLAGTGVVGGFPWSLPAADHRKTRAEAERAGQNRALNSFPDLPVVLVGKRHIPMFSTVWGHCGVARPEGHKLRKSASTFCTLWRLTGQYSQLATFSGTLAFRMTSHSFSHKVAIFFFDV